MEQVTDYKSLLGFGSSHTYRTSLINPTQEVQLSKITRMLVVGVTVAAPLVGSLALAAPAQAGEYVCYGTQTVVHNSNPYTGTTDVNAVVVTGTSNSPTGCPKQALGL